MSAYSDDYLAEIRAARAGVYAAAKPFLQDVEFEPRWHGFARTETRRYEPTGNPGIWTCETLKRGWKRRPKGSLYRERSASA